MPVIGLAHYNLRLERGLMDAVRDFYVDVVGLTVGPRPAFISIGYWLYAGGHDILHLSEQRPTDKRRIGSDLSFDHVALHSTGWPEMQARLVARGVHFTEDHVPGTRRRQVFFRDPAGNGIELIFAEDAA